MKINSGSGKMRSHMKISLTIAFFFLWMGSVFTQEIEFVGSAKQVVEPGENFNLTYTINAQAGNFRGPNLSDFTILAGPSTSTASSIRSVNGRTSMMITYTFSYILQAYKEGTFVIQPASVMIDRKQLQSNPVTIKVAKGASSNQQGQPQGTAWQGRGA